MTKKPEPQNLIQYVLLDNDVVDINIVFIKKINTIRQKEIKDILESFLTKSSHKVRLQSFYVDKYNIELNLISPVSLSNCNKFLIKILKLDPINCELDYLDVNLEIDKLTQELHKEVDNLKLHPQSFVAKQEADKTKFMEEYMQAAEIIQSSINKASLLPYMIKSMEIPQYPGIHGSYIYAKNMNKDMILDIANMCKPKTIAPGENDSIMIIYEKGDVDVDKIDQYLHSHYVNNIIKKISKDLLK
jgi:hypothetical protein